MDRRFVFCLAIYFGTCLLCLGCDDSGSDDDGDNDDDSETNNGQACADMSGTWRIEDHCVKSYIGNTFQIEQTDCTIEATGQSDVQGWQGTIEEDSTIYMSGPTGPEYCEGKLEGDTFSADCEDGCHVACAKQ